MSRVRGRARRAAALRRDAAPGLDSHRVRARLRATILHRQTAPMDPSDALELAKDSGLTLPSPAWIFGCVLFSLLGIAAWRYGKAMKAPRIRWLGLALMLYGYVTSATWLLYLVGIALCVALWWNRPGRD